MEDKRCILLATLKFKSHRRFRQCTICSSDFQAENGKIYCSEQCRVLRNHKARKCALENPRCFYSKCGNEFRPEKRCFRYCSDTCKKASYRERKRMDAADIRHRNKEENDQLMARESGILPHNEPLLQAIRVFNEVSVPKAVKSSLGVANFSRLSNDDRRILLHDFPEAMRAWFNREDFNGSYCVTSLFGEETLTAIREATNRHLPYPTSKCSVQKVEKDYNYLRALDIEISTPQYAHCGNRFYYDGDEANMAKVIAEIPQLAAFLVILKVMFPFLAIERMGTMVNLPNVVSTDTDNAKPLKPRKQDAHVDHVQILNDLVVNSPLVKFGDWSGNFIIAIDKDVELDIYEGANECHRRLCANDPSYSLLDADIDYLERHVKRIKIPAGSIAFLSGDCFHGGVETPKSHPYLRLHGYVTHITHRIGIGSGLAQGWLSVYLEHLRAAQKELKISSNKKRKRRH